MNCRSLSASLFAAIGGCPRLGALHEFNQARRFNQSAAVLPHQHQTAFVPGFVKRGYGKRRNFARELHRQSRAILPSRLSKAGGTLPANFGKVGRFRLFFRHRARSSVRVPRPYMPAAGKTEIARGLFGGLQQIGLAESHQCLAGHIFGHVDDERGVVLLDHLDRRIVQRRYQPHRQVFL